MDLSEHFFLWIITDRSLSVHITPHWGFTFKLNIMGNQIPTFQTFNLPDGREVRLETGQLATQSDGSIVLRIGKTMILATVVSSKKAKEGQSFFPLSVDYQERFAAAGRIPGNFFRRDRKSVV